MRENLNSQIPSLCRYMKKCMDENNPDEYTTALSSLEEITRIDGVALGEKSLKELESHASHICGIMETCLENGNIKDHKTFVYILRRLTRVLDN